MNSLHADVLRSTTEMMTFELMCIRLYIRFQSCVELLQAVIAHVEKLVAAGVPPTAIGVISPYNGQASIYTPGMNTRDMNTRIVHNQP